MNPPEQTVIGVKQFIGILNETLSFAYPLVTVEGEVSSFKVNQGKWAFFDLKDDGATLPCFIPVYQLKVPLEDGMKIRVSGTPKLTDWGKFSFTAKTVTLAGEGALKRAYDLLKKKLQQEGLFDDARKRPLPKFPNRIGLITSGKSAAYSDFIKVLEQRWGGLKVELADIQVQGAAAPDQVINAIEYFNQMAEPVDVLVLIRGGGSLEDLQAFNTEQVARAVAASRTPIIVGVGHEIDVSLADYAADLRAATPTDAARLVVPDRTEIEEIVTSRTRELHLRMKAKVRRSQEQVERFLAAGIHRLSLPRQRIERAEALLVRDISYLQATIKRYSQTVDQLSLLVPQKFSLWQRRVSERLVTSFRLLSGYDPNANLRRGYSITWNNGKIVRSITGTQTGEVVMVQLADGKIRTKVEGHDKAE